MATYQLYFFRKQGGEWRRSIARVIKLECEDDAQAIREVDKHRDELHPYMELWERGRMVKGFEF